MTTGERLRIGLVCPYGLDVPGGVQAQVLGLADALTAAGHRVAVLAPAAGRAPDGGHPAVTDAGGVLGVPWNGSVARVAVGPGAALRARRWLRGGAFDLVHVHEPFVPVLGPAVLRAARCPVVATFHSAQVGSRGLGAVAPLLRPGLVRIGAAVAVSETARRTVLEHYRTDPLVVPNGIDAVGLGAARPVPGWRGTPEAPVVVHLGRLDDPRKGLGTLAAAAQAIAAAHPGVRFLLAGPGDGDAARARFGPVAGRVEVLGRLGERAKASLLAGATCLVAPHLEGESFGLVLAEALAAGAPVVASDLPAFRDLLGDDEDGDPAGVLVPPGDAAALARTVAALCRDPARATALAAAGRERAARFDWGPVSRRLQDVYAGLLAVEDGPDRRGPIATVTATGRRTGQRGIA
jgi:phosphatidyl-myo-inositol alpha-mannosyltransferase